MKVLIVDDEFNARRIVRKYLLEFNSDLILVEASNLEEALIILNSEEIDLMVLDIQLKNEVSFDLFKENTWDGIDVIFVTAYSEFAMEAFDVGALSYVLKPVEKSKLEKAFRKVENSWLSKNKRQERGKTEVNRIYVPLKDYYQLVDLSKVLFLKADGMYCGIVFQDEKSLLVSKPLKYLEKKIEDNKSFVRVHRSYIVNIEVVKRCSSDFKMITLSDSTVLPVSAKYKEVLVDFMKSSI